MVLSVGSAQKPILTSSLPDVELKLARQPDELHERPCYQRSALRPRNPEGHTSETPTSAARAAPHLPGIGTMTGGRVTFLRLSVRREPSAGGVGWPIVVQAVSKHICMTADQREVSTRDSSRVAKKAINNTRAISPAGLSVGPLAAPGQQA